MPQIIKNPVKELLNGIKTLQANYDMNAGPSDPNNIKLHDQADALRAELEQLAPDVAKEIGDGKTGKSLDEIGKYMSDNVTKLSQFDVNMGSGIGNVASNVLGTYAKFDALIASVGNVVSAVNNNRINYTPPVYSGGGGGGTGTGGNYWPAPTQTGELIPTSSVPYVSPSDSGAGYANWLNSQYHRGGIAGLMNFSSANSLKPNEIAAVLQNDETIFQKGQLGSFVDGILGGSSGGSDQTLNVNLTISGDASGVNQDTLNKAVQDGIAQAVREMGRQTRLNNLQIKGVAF
jgi:hypothetical protein